MKNKIKQYAEIKGIEEAEVYLLLLPIIFTTFVLFAIAVVFQNILIPAIIIIIAFAIYLSVKASETLAEGMQIIFEIIVTPKEPLVLEN